MAAYVPVPYAPRERYVPDTRRIGELLGLQGQNSARLAQEQAATSQQRWANLALLVDHYVQNYNQQQNAKAVLGQRQMEQARDYGLKERELAEKEAARKAAEQDKSDALAREQKRDQELRGGKIAESTQYGPIAESQVDDVMAGPAANRARYSFGPGASNGPELQPNPTQQRGIDAEAAIKAMGGTMGVNGQMIMPPKPPVQKSLQRESALVNGKRVFVNFNPETGTYTDLQGQPVQPTPIPPKENDSNVNDVPPGDWAVTGAKFLDTIPADWRKTVEKIARYDEDPNKAVASRGGSRERIMKWVNQVNPDYDQSQFALRSPTRKAFTIGTQGQQINAMNTAMGHLDQLSTLANQLEQGGFVPGNKAWNAIRTAFGSDKVTNFDTLKDALAGEVAGVLSKSGATVSGIQDAKTHISAANSPAQLAGYVNTLIPVLGEKLAAFDYQYKQAMGENDPFSPLSDASKAIIEKHGFDPAHPKVGQAVQPTTMPDLSGLTPGKGRRFSDGPFKGQTWTVDANGTPHRVP